MMLTDDFELPNDGMDIMDSDCSTLDDTISVETCADTATDCDSNFPMMFGESDDVSAQFQESYQNDSGESETDLNDLDNHELKEMLDAGIGCLGICNVKCLTYGCVGKGLERH